MLAFDKGCNVYRWPQNCTTGLPDQSKGAAILCFTALLFGMKYEVKLWTFLWPLVAIIAPYQMSNNEWDEADLDQLLSTATEQELCHLEQPQQHQQQINFASACVTSTLWKFNTTKAFAKLVLHPPSWAWSHSACTLGLRPSRVIPQSHSSTCTCEGTYTYCRLGNFHLEIFSPV